MKILVITPQYPPDGGAAAPLYAMLAERLTSRNHDVTVVCAVPHYPTGRVDRKLRGKWISSTTYQGVRVFRVWVPSGDRTSLAFRSFQFFCYQLGAAVAALFQKCDVALVSNPALTTFLPFVVVRTLRRKPVIFSVHDVYPDVGVSLGIFRNGAVTKTVSILERYCLDRAYAVRTLSKSFEISLVRLGVPRNKIALIYDWVDTELIRPLPRQNRFAIDNNLQSGFVVLYAGNLGLPQGLEMVLEAARHLCEHRDIVFVFVGDGLAKPGLMRSAKDLGLENVRFLPFQDLKRMPEVLATADVSLVVLKNGVGSGALPSKTYWIVSSGRPILASLDGGSEARKLIESYSSGLCVPPDDPRALSNAILRLWADPDLRKRLGGNGRNAAIKHHSPEVAAQIIENLLLAAMGGGEKPTAHLDT